MVATAILVAEWFRGKRGYMGWYNLVDGLG